MLTFPIGFFQQILKQIISGSQINLTYISNGDTNGLFYYLGTNKNTVAWSNPSGNKITIAASSIAAGSVGILTDRAPSEFYTASNANSWVEFNIYPSQLKCSGYSLRNRSNADHYLRNWQLQGSIDDGVTWSILDNQVNNTTLNTPSQWLYLPVTSSVSYSKFRIYETGLNSSNTYYICLGEVELYGSVIVPTPTSTTDPYFANVVNLLHFNGTNGSNTFVDEKGATPVVNGTPTISTAISKYGGASGLFSHATLDYIALPQINFGTGDFTIELWVYPTAALDGTTGILGQNELYLSMFGTALSFWQNGGFVYSFGTNPPLNTWTHLAVSRNNGVLKLFVNGTVGSTQNDATNLSLTGTFNIGKTGNGQYQLYWNGNIDDVRITVGTGRYTANFTPPTTQFPDAAASTTTNVSLTYSSNGDTNGLFYYLGTNKNTVSWVNPQPNKIEVSASSIQFGNVATLTDRQDTEFYTTTGTPDGWVKIHTLTGKLKCNRYSIRNRYRADNDAGSALRNWKLQGSNNDVDWTDLDIQTNNTSLIASSQWLTLTSISSESYCYFRLLETGVNSSGNYAICLSEIELYGEYIPTPISTFLLDGLTGVVSARSVRKINSAYTGYILEASKATGVTQNIGITNSIIDNSALLSFAGSDSVFVKTLYDQVSTFNVAQATLANQPRIVNAGVIDTSGSKTTISYNNQNLIGTIPLSSYPLTIVLVASVTTTNGAFIKIGNGSNGVAVGIGNGTLDNSGTSLTGLNEAIAWIASSTPISTSQMSIIEINSTGSSTNIYLNGVLIVNGGSSYSPSDSYYIGGYIAGSFSRFPNCKISEDIVFNRLLTASERAAMVLNMKDYYNIA